MSWPMTTERDADGQLWVGGCKLTDLAAEYGTPLYVFDEATFRARARQIRGVFEHAWPTSHVVYAGKAYISLTLTAILAEEQIGLDVVSGGELFAGLAAGMPAARMTFHGNNKSRAELRQALDAGIGLIAIDNFYEIDLLRELTMGRDQRQAVVLRLNPGIDAHTNAKMRTGVQDSKFGFAIAGGQAADAAARVVATPGLELAGYHAHIGSQVFEPELVRETVTALMEFGAGIRDMHGVAPRVLSPGGGFGVADDASGADASIAAWAAAAADALTTACDRWNLPRPELVVEPGRAIIGPAGIAMYTVGARKEVPGGRTYVSVDGGMSDNIRPSLYGARYTAAIANRDPNQPALETVAIAGKYCESGDILIEAVDLPRLEPDDTLVIPMAGAYCLSMASNYNLAPRPAVVLVEQGRSRLIRRRETFEDLLAEEIPATTAVGAR